MTVSTDNNPSAARLEAILHLAFGAHTDEEWEQAQEQMKVIAALSDEEVLALGQDEDEPLQHARQGDFLPYLRGGWADQYSAPRVPGGRNIEGYRGGQWIEARALAREEPVLTYSRAREIGDAVLSMTSSQAAELSERLGVAEDEESLRLAGEATGFVSASEIDQS